MQPQWHMNNKKTDYKNVNTSPQLAYSQAFITITVIRVYFWPSVHIKSIKPGLLRHYILFIVSTLTIIYLCTVATFYPNDPCFNGGSTFGHKTSMWFCIGSWCCYHFPFFTYSQKIVSDFLLAKLSNNISIGLLFIYVCIYLFSHVFIIIFINKILFRYRSMLFQSTATSPDRSENDRKWAVETVRYVIKPHWSVGKNLKR